MRLDNILLIKLTHLSENIYRSQVDTSEREREKIYAQTNAPVTHSFSMELKLTDLEHKCINVSYRQTHTHTLTHIYHMESCTFFMTL